MNDIDLILSISEEEEEQEATGGVATGVAPVVTEATPETPSASPEDNSLPQVDTPPNTGSGTVVSNEGVSEADTEISSILGFSDPDPVELSENAQEALDYTLELGERGGIEDLEAAGYTEQEIAEVEAHIAGQQEKNEVIKEEPAFSQDAPTTDMYNGLKMGNPDDKAEGGTQTTAWGLYNHYKNHPDTEQDALGNYFFKGGTNRWRQLYPPSVDYIESAVDGISGALGGEVDEVNSGADLPAHVNLENTVTAGINNGGAALIELGATVGDLAVMGGQALTGKEATGLGLTEKVQDNVGTSSSGYSDMDALIMEGTAMALGFFGGSKTGKNVVDGVEYAVNGIKSTAGKFTSRSAKSVLDPVLEETATGVNTIAAKIPLLNKANWETLMRGIGGEIGAVSAMQSDTDTFLVGEDGLFGVEAGMMWGLKPDDPQALQVLNARLNLLADATAMVFGSEALIRGGMKAAGVVKNVTVNGIASRLLGGDDGANTRAVQAVLDELAVVVSSSTGKDLDAARQAIADALRQNKDVLLEGAEGQNSIIFDSLTAIEGGEFPPQVIAKLRAMKTGALSGSKPNLTAAVVAPSVQIQDEIARNVDTALTNGNTVENVADEVVKTQAARINASEELVSQLEADLLNSDTDAIRAILQGNRFGPEIQKIINANPSEVSQMSEEALKKLARGVVDEMHSLSATKNALFDEIPAGDPFDYRGFGVALGDAVKDSNSFDGSGSQFLQLRLANVLKEGIERASGVELAQLRQYSDESVVVFSDVMEKEGIDFKTLYSDIRPEIAALRDEAMANGNNKVADRLNKLISHIDKDQIAWLETNNLPKSAEAATRAMDYYKNIYTPLARDGDGANIERVIKDNSHTDRNSNELVVDRPINLYDGAEEQVKQTLTQGTARNVQQLADILLRNGSEVDQSHIEEYLVADFFENLYINIRSNGGVGELDEASIAKLVQDMGTQIRALGEGSVLATELDNFSNKILSAKGNKEQILGALNDAMKKADEVRSDSFANMVAPFIDKAAREGDDLVATGNPEAALRSFITGKNGVDNVRRIMQEAEGNEVIREGLEQAYFRELKGAMLGAAENMGGDGRVFKPGAVKALLYGESSISAVGKEIFKDNPKKLKLINAIFNIADRQVGGVGSRAVQGASGTAELQAYQSTINNLIYATVGPLNKMGTKIRAVGNVLANYADITKSFDRAMDLVLADSNLFSEVADRIVSKQGTVGVGKMRIDKESADAMFTLAVRAGLYSESDEQRQEYEGLLGAVFNVEKTINNGLGSVASTVTNILD